MTEHFFNHPLVNLHYYKFGQGDKVMLCFHGYGMHGKQFTLLEPYLGNEYTFYGFDLFFHKQTVLNNNSIEVIKRGLRKAELKDLFIDFCKDQSINKFSVLAYSMGTHYATTLAEQIPERIEEYIVTAPACLKPGAVVAFLSRNKLGNKLLEKLALSDKGMLNLLNLCRKFGFVDDKGHEILHREIATYELRYSFYACATFLRELKTDFKQLVESLNDQNIKSIFIFGKRDSMYPPSIANKIVPKIKGATTIILDENHEMIKSDFAKALTEVLV